MKKTISVALASLGLLAPKVSLAAWDTANLQFFGLPDTTITDLIINAVDILLVALGLFGVLGFLIAGLMYIFAFTDKEGAVKAKNMMKYSAWGIVVGLIGLIVINAIEAFLLGYTDL